MSQRKYRARDVVIGYSSLAKWTENMEWDMGSFNY